MGAGYAGFVPRVMNKVGLTFARATHEALNEFTQMMVAAGEEDLVDCYETGPDALYAKRCPATPQHDDRRDCHIGCSPERPKLCD